MEYYPIDYFGNTVAEDNYGIYVFFYFHQILYIHHNGLKLL